MCDGFNFWDLKGRLSSAIAGGERSGKLGNGYIKICLDIIKENNQEMIGAIV